MNGTPQRVTVRFEEFERYDPVTDTERVRFMAITSLGTFHAEVAMGGPRSKRRDRERFRDRAIECIRSGMLPAEISISEH